eukprot:CAMPEP_0168510642 /NCGR_PEP_ID=MMETSP0405-20121227/1595_1 /TAXON_ID=498012 /ORGANISM="Trichosphaerium sp, Strain Am-I-7 wt" /LENGTH=302 /DNA_ID=CAMNT_0008528535 /DNA_START=388 /DNA_END=1297 /DNA_ORIENTATION=+
MVDDEWDGISHFESLSFRLEMPGPIGTPSPGPTIGGDDKDKIIWTGSRSYLSSGSIWRETVSFDKKFDGCRTGKVNMREQLLFLFISLLCIAGCCGGIIFGICWYKRRSTKKADVSYTKLEDIEEGEEDIEDIVINDSIEKRDDGLLDPSLVSPKNRVERNSEPEARKVVPKTRMRPANGGQQGGGQQKETKIVPKTKLRQANGGQQGGGQKKETKVVPKTKLRQANSGQQGGGQQKETKVVPKTKLRQANSGQQGSGQHSSSNQHDQAHASLVLAKVMTNQRPEDMVCQGHILGVITLAAV